MLIGWIGSVIAISGPTWEQRPQPVYQGGDNTVFVFDLSLSMESDDLPPSRLTRARYKLIDLIHSLTGHQLGLVVFAGDAFVVTPLTDDADTLLNLVNALDTKTPPSQGSRADLAIQRAFELLTSAGAQNGNIILITDGAPPNSIKTSAEIKSSGHRLSILAVGSEQPRPIRMQNGEYLKDRAGNIVLPRVNFADLRAIATAGGGLFLRLTEDNSDVLALTEQANAPRFESLINGSGDHTAPTSSMDSDNSLLAQASGDKWEDMGVWLVIPLLLLASLAFRRGWLLVLPIALSSTLVSEPVHAFSWQDLWLRADQQAANALKDKNFDALSTSELASWRGAGQYRNQQYQAAAKAFADESDPRAHYNRGNALAQAGELEQALAAYDEALAAQPAFPDAQFNRDLVASLLAQAEPPPQSSQSGESGDEGDETQESEQNQSDKGESEQGQTEPAQPEPDQSTQSAQQEQSESQNKGEPESDSDNMEQGEEQAAQSGQDEAPSPEEEQAQLNRLDDTQSMTSEERQALEQWLRQIPDDPGGLLRRKFAYQQQRREFERNQRPEPGKSSETYPTPKNTTSNESWSEQTW